MSVDTVAQFAAQTSWQSLPAGVRDGQTLRLAGQGGAGANGAPSGDLYLRIRLRPHPVFNVRGDDLEVELPVAPWEAVLGAKVEVPTIEGRTLLKIPAGTQNNQKFRLRERGVMNARKNSKGDQIVEVSLVAPDIRNDKARELLKQLAELQPEDPRKTLWAEAETV